MSKNDQPILGHLVERKDEKTGVVVQWQVPLFLHHQEPYGRLLPEPECHALWYYYLLARKNYEEEQDPIVLEGEDDPVYNYHQLFKSIATSYGVEPEKMVKFWKYVDAEAFANALPLLPKNEGLRFDSVVEIETEDSKDAGKDNSS